MALSLLAVEELARIPILVSAGVRQARGKPVDWKRVNSRLRDHKAKVRMPMTIAGDPYQSKEALIEEQKAKHGAAEMHSRTKNAALYSDSIDGVFLKPSEQFDHAKAEEELQFAKNTLKFCEHFESQVAGKLEIYASAFDSDIDHRHILNSRLRLSRICAFADAISAEEVLETALNSKQMGKMYQSVSRFFRCLLLHFSLAFTVPIYARISKRPGLMSDFAVILS